MLPSRIIIKFYKNRGYLSKEVFVTKDQFNLPEVKAFNDYTYWKAKVLNYNEEHNRLFIDVMGSGQGSTDFPADQLEFVKGKQIERINIKNLPTSILVSTAQLSTAPIVTSARQLDNTTSQSLSLEMIKSMIQEAKSETEAVPAITEKQPPAERTINTAFTFHIKKLLFGNGRVSFRQFIAEAYQDVDFVIYNECLREEYDAIKNYFANILGTKKITVFAKIQMRGESIITVEATSAEIQQIQPHLIEQIRSSYTKYLINKRVAEDSKKATLTMEEFFEALDERSITATSFYAKEDDLVAELLRITDSKHYKHLRYLSDKHSNSIMKLRFVIKPFSFLFLLEGKEQYHLVWETLDTEEATYIWHIEKSLDTLKKSFQKVEEDIQIIKLSGKNAFLKSLEDDTFQRINHKYAEPVGGFIEWKDTLESYLI